MNASLLAVLNNTERLLVAQTERAELAALDEDAAIDLEARIRRARNKYVGQYRRGASARVGEHGARGSAALRAERLAAARATRQSQGPGPEQAPEKAEPAAGRQGPPVTAEPTGDRALRSPRTEKQRAGTLAAGARRQAKRDSR